MSGPPAGIDVSGLSGRLELYAEYCSSVPMPLSDTSRQTRIVMELLLDRGHFEDLCNLAFGPMYNPDATPSSLDPNAHSWMDVANNAPAEVSKFRSSLRKLLSPNGGLHNIMTAVSSPSGDFHSKISNGWKDGDSSPPRSAPPSSFLQRHNQQTISESRRDATDSLQSCYRRTFAIPLRSITPHAKDILRSFDTDLTDFSAGLAPSSLFIPFWEPPMTTGIIPASGESLSNNQVTVNMKCTMLGYFLIRLSMYAAHRSQIHGMQIMNGSLSNGRISRYFNWMAKPKIKAVINHVNGCVYGDSHYTRPATDSWTFYEDLLVEYMQYYTKVDMVKNISGQRYTDYLPWDTETCSAAILAHFPAQILIRSASGLSKDDTRGSNSTVCEGDRTPLYKAGQCAMVAKSLLFITELFTSNYDLLKELPGNCQNHLIPSQSEERAYSEVVLPCRAVYKTCLIAVRQMVVSIPHYPYTPNQVHFDFIRLFRILCTTPNDFTDVDRKFYFMSHYEVYSYLLRDILRYVFTTNFCTSGDRVTIRCLRRTLEELADEDTLHVLLKEAHGVVERDNAMELSRIQGLFVLDWTSNQSPTLISPFGPEVISAAARARLAIEHERKLQMISTFKVDKEIDVPESDEVPPVKTLLQKVRGGEPNIYRIHELIRLDRMITKLFPSSTEEITNIKEGRGASMSASPNRNRVGHATTSAPYTPLSKRAGSFGELTSPKQDNNNNNNSRAGTTSSVVASGSSAQAKVIRAATDLGPGQDYSLSSQGWRGNLTSRLKATPRVMTTRERLTHLQGHGESLHPSQCRGLRFSNGSIDSKSYHVHRQHEMAILLPIVSLLDSVLQWIQIQIVSWKVPRCPRGHKLVLVSDVRRSCTRHLADRGVWECLKCHSAACEICVPSPLSNITGATFRRYLPYAESNSKRNQQDAPVSEVCSQCYLVIRGEFAVAYENVYTHQVMCPQCAMRPINLISVRFLASTTFYLYLIAAFLLYFFLKMLFWGSSSSSYIDHDEPALFHHL